jgi:hypothetical protein
MELATNLARTGDFGLYQFFLSLTSSTTAGTSQEEKFFIGRMVVREAKKEFGVHPGDDEISEYIRNMRAFANPEGKFDEQAYRNFIEKGIGRLGMTENDLRELVSDSLAMEKISGIVGAGLGMNRDMVAFDMALDNQRVSGSLARLDLDPFEEKIQPTDEEVKTYWETLQDAFTTAPRRRFTYIIATPDMPADPTDSANEPETLAEAAATDEAKAVAEKKKAEEKAKKDAELAEARRKKQIELDGKVDDFTFQLGERKDVSFEDLAKEYGWEVKTSELFTQASPPPGLDAKLRASSSGGSAVDELFRIVPSSDPLSKISPPIGIGENQWLVARLDEDEKSRPKTFEEAKVEARVQLVREKATEALKLAAIEALEKIKSAMASGKSFADAAKEAGINEVREFTRVTRDSRPDPAAEPSNLFTLARYVDAGSFAEVVMEQDRAFIVHVASREVEKQADLDARVDTQISSLVSQNEMATFIGWLADRIDAAKVQTLYRN